MEPLIKIASGIIFFGAGLCLMMAFEQITAKNRDKISYILFFQLTTNSIISLIIGMTAIGLPLKYPITVIFFLTCVYLNGPLTFLYYNALFYPGSQVFSKIKIHLLPAAVMAIIELLFQLQSAGIKKQYIQALFEDPARHLISFLIIFGVVHMLIYLVYLLKIELSVWNSREIRTEVRISVVMNIFDILSIFALAIGFILKLKYLFLAGGVVVNLGHILVFLGHNRYPRFFQMLRKEVKQKRYEKSMLEGLDTDLILNRLIELMDEEKLYSDFELNLNSLARKLSITPRQLSQFLNERLDVDFRNFVNKYRVEDAKMLLISNPEESILTICFSVGFNSKSSFNATFKKFTGKSPREFRKSPD